MSEEQIRAEFEKRTAPNWNFKKTKEGRYYYVAVEMSWLDFRDGWQAALSSQATNSAELDAETVATNDREMLNYLMQAFDSETWNCERCGHAEDCTTMDSARFLREYLSKYPAAATNSDGELVKDAERYRYAVKHLRNWELSTKTYDLYNEKLTHDIDQAMKGETS